MFSVTCQPTMAPADAQNFPSGLFQRTRWTIAEMIQLAPKTTGNQPRTRVRRGISSPGLLSAIRARWASRIARSHRRLATKPRIETAARCGLLSAVPSAATRKLLGIRNSSVTFTRSGWENGLDIGRLIGGGKETHRFWRRNDSGFPVREERRTPREPNALGIS